MTAGSPRRLRRRRAAALRSRTAAARAHARCLQARSTGSIRARPRNSLSGSTSVSHSPVRPVATRSLSDSPIAAIAARRRHAPMPLRALAPVLVLLQAQLDDLGGGVAGARSAAARAGVAPTISISTIRASAGSSAYASSVARTSARISAGGRGSARRCARQRGDRCAKALEPERVDREQALLLVLERTRRNVLRETRARATISSRPAPRKPCVANTSRAASRIRWRCSERRSASDCRRSACPPPPAECSSPTPRPAGREHADSRCAVRAAAARPRPRSGRRRRRLPLPVPERNART